MSQIFGWVPIDAAPDASAVVNRMAAALIVDGASQRVRRWHQAGLAIGVIEPPALRDEVDDVEPAQSADRRFTLWMAGEAYASHDPGLELRDVAQSRTHAFRRALLQRWLDVGVKSVRALDGEYHIAVWDAANRTLSLVNDRFGGLPWYWAETARGFAFGGGVRGVLMAPAVEAAPDLEALREAVSFGGYRLADRTNVAAVKMVDGATVQTVVNGRRSASTYSSWRDIGEERVDDARDIVPMVHDCWQRAIARRTSDRARYGQTLSGGLDSRAILAEAGRGPEWTAITYGIPGCDDARYGERAAATQGVTWIFCELYRGDWLRTRSSHIQATDGLIELGDLMHLESLPAQRERFDIHLSGYIGDVVSGSTYAAVRTVDDVLAALPWYGATISLPHDRAKARAQQLIDALEGAPPRFALYAHKLPQSTNRWTAAWRPWLRVRKPFVDYAFFDLCQALPSAIRLEGRLHERWLRAAYPRSFATIPNQKTGMPVLTPDWRVQLERIRRGVRARLIEWVPERWRPAPRVRSYHDNGYYWRAPGTVEAITAPILRPDSLSIGVFGRPAVTALVERWKASAAAPAQIIGALYVYETYHADLARVLAGAAARAAQFTPLEQLIER
jgi:hypothetical protein